MTKLVAIGTPAYNNAVTTPYVRSLMRSRDALHEAGISTAWLTHGNVAAVPRMRNLIVAEALSLGASDLVFIDSDITWEPEYLIQLLNHDVDIVGAVMPTTDNRSETGMKFPFRPINMRLEMMASGVAKVEALPTAFLRIRESALKSLVDKAQQVYTNVAESTISSVPLLFDYTLQPYGPEGAPMHAGEDFSFCVFARENGYDIWVDPNIPLGHIKHGMLYGSLGDVIQNHEGKQ